jgi:hypothetical protein
VWKDSEKEESTLTNHFHGVSSSGDDVLKLTDMPTTRTRTRTQIGELDRLETEDLEVGG